MKSLPYFILIAFMLLGTYTENIYTTSNETIADLYQKIVTLQQENTDIEDDLIYFANQRIFTKDPVMLFPLVIKETEGILTYYGKGISSYYANRLYPLKQNTGGSLYKVHNALDIVGIEGARTKLIVKGKVLHKWYEKGIHFVNGRWQNFDGNSEFNGYTIFELLDKWKGWTAGYGHIANITVHEGDIVEAGYPFAIINPEVDSKSTGPHLHFWLKNPDGEFVNPMNYIGRDK